VVVPQGVDVRIIADAGNDEVSNEAGLAPTAPPLAGTQQRDGNVDLDVTSGTAPTVLVRAELGVGRLSIVRER
jgi:hypothetical protein